MLSIYACRAVLWSFLSTWSCDPFAWNYKEIQQLLSFLVIVKLEVASKYSQLGFNLTLDCLAHSGMHNRMLFLRWRHSWIAKGLFYINLHSFSVVHAKLEINKQCFIQASKSNHSLIRKICLQCLTYNCVPRLKKKIAEEEKLKEKRSIFIMPGLKFSSLGVEMDSYPFSNHWKCIFL